MRSLRKKLEHRYLVDRGIGSGAEFAHRLINTVGTNGTLLDLGCGEGKLRRQLPPDATYIGLDRYAGVRAGEYTDWHMRPGVIGDAHHLPLVDGCVSVAVALSVLEHLKAPEKALAEVYRVLQPGGWFFVDVPFMHQIHHAPNDYFRYTPYSLRELAEQSGFEVNEIRPSGGYARFIAYALRQAPTMIRAPGFFSTLVRSMVCWPLAALGLCVEKLQYTIDIHDTRQELVCGYHVILRKSVHE